MHHPRHHFLAALAALTNLLWAQSPTSGEPPQRVTEAQLDAAIQQVTGGKKLTYDPDGYVNSSGKVVKTAKGKDGKDAIVAASGLSCSPFASAILH
jgi:hypothetical protein